MTSIHSQLKQLIIADLEQAKLNSEEIDTLASRLTPFFFSFRDESLYLVPGTISQIDDTLYFCMSEIIDDV